MIYYERKGIVLRTATGEDVEEMKGKLRASDVEEVQAIGHTPEQGLRKSLGDSIICITLEYCKRPIAMCGIAPDTIVGERAVIWLLGTDEIKRVPKIFFKMSLRVIRFFNSLYPYLYNFVYCRNVESMDWLTLCGAEFGDTIPYGDHGEYFKFFVLRRK
ncbi:DUF2833 domain-containing protein [Gammaproteobacteria bacterium]